MKYVVVKTVDSAKRKLDPNNRGGCFELFGYDFMVDSDMTAWLIEVNTNPCLDESSAILKLLLPRMIDDAFKLTVDREFPNPLIYQKMKLESFVKNHEHSSSAFPHKHSTGYTTASTKVKKGSTKFADLPKKTNRSSSKSQKMQSIQKQIDLLDAELTRPQTSQYPVPGHPDSENLWERIMDIKCGNGALACRQRFNLRVNQRVLRGKEEGWTERNVFATLY